MVVFWATRLRGFLKHVSACLEDVEFLNSENTYEVSSISHKLKSKLIRSHVFDLLGLFQVLSISGKDCDYYGSFNRFLRADKPYFIYLENPTALYHYALGRVRFGLGKRRFENCLRDPNLKYIVCMSDACKDTFEKVNMPLPETVPIRTIYPLVPQNVHVNEDVIRRKSYDEVLECLYCVQGKRFLTKGGLDVLEAVSRLRSDGMNIHLTVITKLSDLNKRTRKAVERCDGVSLHDFSFSYSELETIYANTSVLLQPSSDDSCPLTVLEAMKGGCAVIGSQLYAIPEMVENQGCGSLLEPKFRIFTKENIPNPENWKHWKKRWQARKKNEAFVQSIQEAICQMYVDRDRLCRFSLRALEIANTKFGAESICRQWEDVWNMLKGS